MRLRVAAVVLAVAGIACLAAVEGCGLTIAGSFEGDGGTTEEAGDGAPGGECDASGGDCHAPACNCVGALPAGWTLAGVVSSAPSNDAGVELDASAPLPSLCPAGWGTPRTLLV